MPKQLGYRMTARKRLSAERRRGVRRQIATLKDEAARWRDAAAGAEAYRHGETHNTVYLCNTRINPERLALFKPDADVFVWWGTELQHDMMEGRFAGPSEGRVFAALFLAEMCDDEIRELRRRLRR